MNQRPPLFSPLLQSIQVFLKCFFQIALFEIIYKALTAVLIRPLLSVIFQFLLTVSGHRLAFNEQILSFLFSVPGILSVIILIALSTFLVYFEFAVLINIVRQTVGGKKADLALAITTALWSFRSLRHPSTLLFALYSLVLLPISNIGITSSLLPELTIPTFISGELSKSFFGELVLLLFFILVGVIFFWLLFSLPAMICEHCSFLQAAKKSIYTIRCYRLKTLGILVAAAAIWMLGFFLPRYLSTSIFGSPTVSFLDALTQFGLSAKTPIALLLWLLLALFAQVLLTPMLLTVLTYYYLQVGNPVEDDNDAISRISSRLYKTGIGSKNVFSKIWQVLRGLIIGFWNNSFVKKHRALVSVALFAVFALLIYQLFFTVYRVHDPIVVGHRGCAYAVENTLEAIDYAAECGADFVEIDVQLSADGIPMVVHDTNLRRLTGENVNVYDLTCEELQALTLEQDGQTGTIPTLAEVLKHCEKRVLLAVELKSHGRETKSLVEETMKLVGRDLSQKGCMVFSQEYDLVQELTEGYSEYIIGYCVYGNLGKMTSAKLRSMNIDFLLVEEAMVSKSLINAGRKSFVAIYVWTVNDTARMQQYLDMGVLGLITDYPDEAADILDALRILSLQN